MSKKFHFNLLYLTILFGTTIAKHFTTIELENLKDKSVLVKLDLVNITEFASKETISVIFFYRTLTEIVWIEWLEKVLPIISPYQIGIIDCDSDKNYNAKNGCFNLGFNPPSIRIYRYGYTFSEYDQEKNARSFVKYLKRIIPNELVRLDDSEKLQRFLNENNQSVVVGFFRNESVLEKIFINVAQELPGVIFGYSSDEKVLKSMNLYDNVALFRPKYLENGYEENFVNYTEKSEENLLKNFIKINQHGLVGIRNYFNVDDFPKPQIIVYFDLNNKDDFKKIRELTLRVAEDFKSITFAVSDKKDFINDLLEFGIESKRIFYSKVLVLGQTEKNYKYVLDEFKTVRDLKEFAIGLEKKSLPQFIKSQDLKHSEPHSESSRIHLAVGSNFLQLVNKISKDLLVLLFNFDCFQSLISVDFAAKEFEKESDKIGFLAMNVHLNDVPRPFYFNHCPTIFFATRGSKNKPLLYGGSPDYKKLIRFIRENIH
nr:probable protein disulfide-isomerase ER-60 [Onthophagus taurus]